MNQTKEQIIEKAKVQRADMDQYYRDVDHWNRTHPDEEPIDPDPDGALADQAAKLDQIIGIPDHLRAAAA